MECRRAVRSPELQLYFLPCMILGQVFSPRRQPAIYGSKHGSNLSLSLPTPSHETRNTQWHGALSQALLAQECSVKALKFRRKTVEVIGGRVHQDHADDIRSVPAGIHSHVEPSQRMTGQYKRRRNPSVV